MASPPRGRWRGWALAASLAWLLPLLASLLVARENAFRRRLKPFFAPLPSPALSHERCGGEALSVGLISDLHYAERANRWWWENPGGWGMRRFYRNSLRVLEDAAEAWRAANVTDVFVLGDSVDASSGKGAEGSSREAFARVLARLEGFRVHFALGNHDLEALTPRAHLLRLAGIQSETGLADNDPGGEAAYYAVRMEGIKWIVLDSYHVSTYWPRTHANYAEARAMLSRHREHFSRPERDPNLKGSGQLRGPARRFVSLGGALGAPQRRWLARELRDSGGRGEAVAVVTHVPISPGVVSKECGAMCLLWDYEEVLDILNTHSTTVLAVFTGHDHPGGYFYDDDDDDDAFSDSEEFAIDLVDDGDPLIAPRTIDNFWWYNQRI
mmetsp:Transcript_4240/g.10909  ORF Transcript_4240/g.10909 Transcript_4240/m.10909 type:complete len:383 (+) Transcript_4240:48-1196(+)